MIKDDAQRPKSGTSQTVPWKWLLLAIPILTALGFFGLLILRAGQGKADALDTFLISVLGIIGSVIVSVIVGRRLAMGAAQEALRPFLRAAFRGHVELVQGLYRVQARSHNRDAITDPVLEQEWQFLQELINEQSQRALEGLENWRELLPEGVKDFETKLRQNIEEQEKVNAAISEISELAPMREQIQNILDDLNQERDRLAHASPYAAESPVTVEPRRLLLAGAYGEATAAYTQLISQHPRNYTLYQARARAKYMSGDKEGALADLAEAERLHPDDPHVERVREIIKEDKALGVPSVTSFAPLQFASDGNTSLASGNGQEALEAYERADKGGLLPVFSHQNYAMAYLVKGEVSEAREALAKVDYNRLGPFVKVQQDALLALCSILEEKGYNEELAQLKQSIAVCPTFDLRTSPLRFLESGLKVKIPDNPDIELTFGLLRCSYQTPISFTTEVRKAYFEAFGGNASLSSGNGQEALEAYERADKGGLKSIASHQNYAMAYLVKGEVSEARGALAKVDYNLLGPFVKVQQGALLALCLILEEKGYNEELAQLKQSIATCPTFDLEHSPLRFLESGLKVKIIDNPDIELVFRILREAGREETRD